ncbi:MAG: hypothetical protein ACI33P_10455 [Lysinibacillus sp.]
MKKFKKTWMVASALTLSLGLAACGDEDEPDNNDTEIINEDDDNNIDTNPDTNPDTDTNTDTETDVETDIDPETETDTDPTAPGGTTGPEGDTTDDTNS